MTGSLKDNFITKSNKIHGDKYDYSKVEYVNNKTKVIITCPVHGDFEQIPLGHIRSTGCRKCSGLAPITKEEFIKRAEKKHGNRFDFSEVDYKGYNKYTEFTCSEHGKFRARPIAIVKDIGCQKCSFTNSCEEEVIDEFKKVHGNFYDYSKVVYVNTNTKVNITCPVHGEFKQRPKQHKRGEGCYYCGMEKSIINGAGFFSKKRAKRYRKEWEKIKTTLYYVYIVSDKESFYKIGITTTSIEDRLKRLKTDFNIVYKLDTNLYKAILIENDILERCREYKYDPNEKFGGYTECFNNSLPIEQVQELIFN